VNELTRVDNTAYEYDAAGNLATDGAYSYFWDYENRLTRAKLVSDGPDASATLAAVLAFYESADIGKGIAV
jgi:hypothetical protein